MAITRVSSQTAVVKGIASNLTINFPSNVVAGDLLVLFSASWSSPTGVTITNSGAGISGATWTTHLGPTTGGGERCGIAWAFATANGAASPNWEWTGGGSFMSLSCDEFAGVSGEDALGSGSTGSDDSPTDPITTGVANCLIVQVSAQPGTSDQTADSPWIEINHSTDNSGGQSHLSLYRIVTTATSYSPDAHLSGSQAWRALSLSFSPAQEPAAPGAGSVTLTGAAATVSILDPNPTRTPAAAAVTLTGAAPFAVVPQSRAPLVGAIALTGIAPAVGVALSIDPFLSGEPAWTTGYQKAYPYGATSATVTPSGVAWTSSAWVTLAASASDDGYLTGAVVRADSGAGVVYGHGKYELDVGIGGAGSEVVIHTVRAMMGNAVDQGGYIQFPIAIAGIVFGERIAVRIRTNDTDTSPYYVAITWLPLTTYAGNLLVTSTPGLVMPSNSLGLVVQDGGAAWVDGTWVQFSAAIATGMVITHVVLQGGYGHAYEFEIDIGTGAAASEVVRSTVSGAGGSLDYGPSLITLLHPLVIETAGVRLALRIRSAEDFPYSDFAPRINLNYHPWPLVLV